MFMGSQALTIELFTAGLRPETAEVNKFQNVRRRNSLARRAMRGIASGLFRAAEIFPIRCDDLMLRYNSLVQQRTERTSRDALRHDAILQLLWVTTPPGPGTISSAD